MSLMQAKRADAKRILGIDASTNSVAFTLFVDGKPSRWGKIEMDGDIYEKVRQSRVRFADAMKELNPDYVVIESAILVRSPDASIKIAMVVGSIIGSLEKHVRVITVKPTEWQNYIGNRNWTKVQKDSFKVEHPGYKESWYSNKIREKRKQFTVDYFNKKYSIELDDFDVADSFGVAYFATERL
jgi:Holliday junction resolvasome RuvABC endonuclease subunit